MKRISLQLVALAVCVALLSLIAPSMGFTLALVGGAAASDLAAKGLPGRGYTEFHNILTGGAIANSGLTTFGKDFPMGEGWLKMLLRFNNTFTVGTGTTAIAEGELLVIKNVQLKSDRGEIFCNLPGRAIFKISIYQTGQVARKDAIAASTAVYRVTLPIVFADVLRMNRPMDTACDTSRYQSVILQVNYGSTADLLSTPGTSTNVATLDVEVERTLGKLPPKGKPIMHINYDSRQPVDASATTFIDLERAADLNMKRLYVHSCTGGTAGVAWSGVNADTIQNVIDVVDQNRSLHRQRIHAMIQDGNKIDAYLEAAIAGVEVFDFVRDGALTGAVQTGNKSTLQYKWTNQGGVGANSIVTATCEGVRTLK